LKWVLGTTGFSSLNNKDAYEDWPPTIYRIYDLWIRNCFFKADKIDKILLFKAVKSKMVNCILASAAAQHCEAPISKTIIIRITKGFCC